MPDQNHLRSYRPHEPHSRAGAIADGGRGDAGDPLAELARLIGQSDPFADLERERLRDGAQPLPRSQPLHTSPDAFPAPAPTDPHGHGEQAFDHYPDDYYAAADGSYPPGYENYYSQDGVPLDEIAYHEEELVRRRRRRRIAIVAVFFGLAVIGSAGAFGYNHYFLTRAADVPPPVIKAQTAPTKVIPAARVSDSQSSKLIRDRVSDPAGGEKVVPRKERPVEIKKVAVTPVPQPAYALAGSDAPIAPRSTTTVPVVASQPTDGIALPVASTPSEPVGPSALNTPPPKKVRTLTIRPDMTVVQDTSQPWPAPANPPVASMPPASPAQAARADGDRTASAAPRTATPRSEPRLARSDAVPLSLAPADNAPPRMPAVGARQPQPGTGTPLALAATAPPVREPGPASTQSVGGYAVQVSSQRSETDARASFRTLQGRYPNVLGGRQPFVRRVDLGSRGVYFRAMVGPFATAEDAAQLCSSLKAAGGQCLIQRN
jgi:hypothetical protein